MPLDQLREFDAGRGERIPLLADVLDQFRLTPLIVELKVIEAARPALELVATHHARDRVVFGSFLHAALKPARSAGAFTSASQCELVRLLPAAALRRAPRAVPFQAVMMPPSYYGMPLPVGGYARATKVPVHVWTVNDPKVARRLRIAGACGIITDDPAALRANA
jgi:glycerophosphoryl diester phosphodiesterase